MAIGITLNVAKNAEEAEDEPSSISSLLTFEVVKMVALSAIGGFLFGYDTGIVSGAMIYIRDDFQLDDLWQEVIISITILAAWMFSIASGTISDKIGRRKVVIISSIIFTVGSLLMGAAQDKWTLLVGRFTVGAGIGLASMIIPLYIAELAPSKIRGSLVTTNNLFITGGQAISAFVAVGFSYLPDTVGWRFMLGIACIPSIIQFFGFLTMPESPRWLIRNGQEEEAYKVLQKLRGPEACIDKEFNRILAVCAINRVASVASSNPEPSTSSNGYPTNLTNGGTFTTTNNNKYSNGLQPVASSSKSDPDPVSELKRGLDVEDSSSGFWRVLIDVLKDKYLRRALLVGCVLQATQQLTGINTVMYYSATIIQMSGVANKGQAVWMASVTAMVNFLTTFIGVYVVDKIGRRKLTLGSLIGVILSLLLLAVGFRIEAMYSPAIGFRSSDPIDSECSFFTDCNGCRQSLNCGFCYPVGNLNNGSCLKTHPDEPLTSSARGVCYFPSPPNEPSIVSSLESMLFANRVNGGSNSTIGNATMSPILTTSPANYVWSYDICPAHYSFIVLGGLCLYLLTFGPGMGPMPWTINSEIYPLWARTTCCSITTSMSWFFNMLISLTFLTLVRGITREGAFALYATFGVVGFIFLFFFLPETKGKNLEETYAMFRRSHKDSSGKRKSSSKKQKLKSSPLPPKTSSSSVKSNHQNRLSNGHNNSIYHVRRANSGHQVHQKSLTTTPDNNNSQKVRRELKDTGHDNPHFVGDDDVV